MDEEAGPFSVSEQSGRVAVRIRGRASFANVAPLRVFFKRSYERGIRNFIIDFSDCSSMDSTFMGVLAELALKLLQDGSGGQMVLCSLSVRNCELICNLGLHRLSTVQDAFEEKHALRAFKGLDQEPLSESGHKSLVREAHEFLIEADSGNAAKFKDLLSLLKEEA